MRRFRLDSAKPGEFHSLASEIYCNYMMPGWRTEAGDAKRGTRGWELLAHWWAAGHDPARSLRSQAKCKLCHGSGMDYDANYDEDFPCPACSGTGEAKL